MTSGCKVGVLIPELLGTLCGCPWRCLWAAFWEFFPIPLCGVAGLVPRQSYVPLNVARGALSHLYLKKPGTQMSVKNREKPM